jgi:hypothetical protein
VLPPCLPTKGSDESFFLEVSFLLTGSSWLTDSPHRPTSIAQDFVNKYLERCPAGREPTSRSGVIKALCEFAAKPPHYSRATRDALMRALGQLVEEAGDVAVTMRAPPSSSASSTAASSDPTLRFLT